MCGSLQGSILLPRQSTLLAPPTLQLESHSKGRLLSTQLMTSRPARGAFSYGVVCHTCGCWLVTKPDCFSGLFTVLTEEETGELFGQFWATILCSIMLETCRQRVLKEEPRRKAETVRKQVYYPHHLQSCPCVLHRQSWRRNVCMEN